MNIHDFKKMKLANQKITMLTCYDFNAATIIDKTNVNCVLVGDSVAMTMHGLKDTTGTTLEMMIAHTKAVAKGLTKKFLIADLPFLSYRKSLAETITCVQGLIQAGAHAVKLEGAVGNFETIQHIVNSGIPVMGHIGLTPQSIHTLGGHKVQGRDAITQTALIQQATMLEKSGCFAIVLECIPAKLAKKISENLTIPTIGIGAGPYTNGQVLVWQDLLGLQTEFKPKFLKKYLNGSEIFLTAINQYVNEVTQGEYPIIEEHAY